ncbi:unnamed protein product [Adineta steineri]|uniref:Protein kinase domain-containing protein n=1 Tax=Adineta steineri TaxID=433720 RepID=A0A815ENU6_9BILA|nr:unnamed protein product [Adineta steineri]CAF3847571.1 unnamed protein product [Adineta steineri]
MPLLPSPIPPPVFDSDESDVASQQSTDSSSYLSSQFTQHTRLSYSPKYILNQQLSIHFDDSLSNQDDSSLNFDSILSTKPIYKNKKRKRSHDKSEEKSLHTPNQSPYTRRKNLSYVQENTFQSPKIQRRSRQCDESIHIPTTTFSNLININPFVKHRYHTRLVAKRQSLISLSIQRFEQEFHHDSFLGHGEFSHVYLCTNRLDGLNYAIKTSKQSIIGTSYEQIAWREICAYAILTSHENLVRYYSAWIELDGRFFIQLEYCNGGSLEDLIEKNRQINEQELINILHQLSDVLSFLHGKDLAHLDIKPSNIMICQYSENNIRYKLTDLGHISQISSCTIDEDGDSRYLALESLQKSHTKKIHLDKCDIFSLGLTLYVCATNYNLPKQGNEWQQLRLNITQYLHSITHCSKQFNDLLLERMCNIDPNQRPSAYDLLLNPTVNPIEPTSRESLRHSLKQEREKNSLLNKKLLDHYLFSNSYDVQMLPNDIQFQQGFLSPLQSILVPQEQNLSTPNNHSRILLINSPNTPICCTNMNNQTLISPGHCGSFAMKQIKLTGSNMFRHYSSII